MAAALDGGPPLVFAHRGDSAHAPENTIEAAALGLDAGAVGWEFDVGSTRDGVPVLLHDPGLARTTNVTSAFADDPRRDLDFLLAEFTLEEVARLDAGAWFVAPEGRRRSARAFGTLDRLDPDRARRYASGAVRVPTLDEALAFTLDRGGLANVEVKSAHDGDFRLLDAVIAAVKRRDADRSVLISSFDHAEVARVAASEPGIASAVLSDSPLHRPVAYVRGLVGADAYHVSAAAIGLGGPGYRRGRSPKSLREAELIACRRERLPVLVFTVNEPGPGGAAGHLAQAGVAGLFSDDPRAIVAGFTPS